MPTRSIQHRDERPGQPGGITITCDLPAVVVQFNGEEAAFGDPFSAAKWLLQRCSPREVQSLKLEAGRAILATFPIQEV